MFTMEKLSSYLNQISTVNEIKFTGIVASIPLKESMYSFADCGTRSGEAFRSYALEDCGSESGRIIYSYKLGDCDVETI